MCKSLPPRDPEVKPRATRQSSRLIRKFAMSRAGAQPSFPECARFIEGLTTRDCTEPVIGACSK